MPDAPTPATPSLWNNKLPQKGINKKGGGEAEIR
jgi:hypothetical protein